MRLRIDSIDYLTPMQKYCTWKKSKQLKALVNIHGDWISKSTSKAFTAKAILWSVVDVHFFVQSIYWHLECKIVFLKYFLSPFTAFFRFHSQQTARQLSQVTYFWRGFPLKDIEMFADIHKVNFLDFSLFFQTIYDSIQCHETLAMNMLNTYWKHETFSCCVRQSGKHWVCAEENPLNESFVCWIERTFRKAQGKALKKLFKLDSLHRRCKV